VLGRVAFKPFPYPNQEIPASAPGDKLKCGRYRVNFRLLSYACHADFSTNDDSHPEKSPGWCQVPGEERRQAP
jgi:hypothetical protein